MSRFSKLLIVFVILLHAYSLNAQTNVSGFVNGTWTAQNSPYLVNGHLWIQDSDSLIIQPGVTVQFQGNYKLKVSGYLKALGNVNDSIVFTAVQDSVWGGIFIDNGTDQSDYGSFTYTILDSIVSPDFGAMNDNDSTILEYCHLERTYKNHQSSDWATQYRPSGGAFYVKEFDKVRISHCSFTANSGLYGGAVFCEDANLVLNNCRFYENGSDTSLNINNGGALGVRDGRLEVYNCTFSDNKAVYGGAVSVWDAYVRIDSCEFLNNKAIGGPAGAIYLRSCSYSRIENTLFEGNTAHATATSFNSTDGGAIYATGYAGYILNCKFLKNSTDRDGGAISITYSPSNWGTTKLINSLFANNFAADDGGAVNHSYRVDLKYLANTFAYNKAYGSGGGVYCDRSDISLNDCILWGNTAGDSISNQVYYYRNWTNYGWSSESSTTMRFRNVLIQDYNFSQSGPTATHSYFESKYWEYTNVIKKDPGFINPTSTSGDSAVTADGLEPNYDVIRFSPAVEGSEPTSYYDVSFPAEDINGNPRLTACNYDIGCYEHPDTYGGTIDVDSTWSGQVIVDCRITVDAGATLTIEPGTEVIFGRKGSLRVVGELVAEGTVTDSIYFIGADTINGWRDISFYNGYVNGQLSPGSTVIRYCHFENQKDYIPSSNSTGFYREGALRIGTKDDIEIEHCTFKNVYSYQGAINISYTNLSISNNKFIGCKGFYGACIYAENSTLELHHNIFTENVARYQGGGLYALDSDVSVHHNLFTKAYRSDGGSYYGGGLYIKQSTGEAYNNEFTFNKNGSIGGAIYLNQSPFEIRNNLFANNEAASGACIAISTFDEIMIVGNTFANNKANTYSGAVYSSIYSVWSGETDNITLSHNVFSGNESRPPVNEYVMAQYGNTSDIYFKQGINLIFSNNLFEDTTNVRNIDLTGSIIGAADFINPSDSAGCYELTSNGQAINYRLMGSSDAIDAGVSDTTGMGIGAYDLDGELRIVNDTIDLGCYEFSCYDQYAPVAVSMDTILYLDINGTATLLASNMDDGSTDDCGITNETLSLIGDQSQQNVNQLSLNANHIGTHSLVFTVYDSNGTSDNQTKSLTVLDTIAPDVTCMDQDFELNANGEFVLDASMLIANDFDNCGIVSRKISVQGDLSLQDVDSITFDCNNTGSYVIELELEDASGNTSGCTANITVSDNENPLADFAGSVFYVDAAGQLTLTATEVGAASSDNCTITSYQLSIVGDNAMQYQSSLMFDCTKLGSYLIMLYVEDASGNRDSLSSNITVSDTITPVAVCSNQTVYLDASGTASVSVAEINNGTSDNCELQSIDISLEGDANQQNSATINFDCTHIGTQNVVLSATDNSSNTDYCQATVEVLDTISPATLGHNLTVYLDANGTVSVQASDVENGSTDNCGITSTGIRLASNANAQFSTQLSFDCSQLGANSIVYRASDASGNTHSVAYAITVLDTISPTMSKQDINVYLDTTGQATIQASDVDNGSSDNCGITSYSLSKTTFNCSNIGANQVALSAADVSGNESIIQAQVTISDTISPVLVSQDVSIYLDATGAATITVGDIDNGSTDNCNLATLTISQSVFDCSMVGANNVTLYGEDDYGNNTSKVAVVTVLDTISPTVVAQNQTLHLDANGAATLQLSNVENGSSDNCAIASSKLSVVGDSSRQNMSELLFICDDLGGNTITYTVVDVNGNASSVNVNVLIEDTIEPTALAQNVTIYLNTAGEATLTAIDVNDGSSDNCSITEYLLSKTDYNCSDLGIEYVQLKVTDPAGNSDSISALVTILDTISPVLMPADISVYLDANGTAQITETDVDNGSYDNCTLTTLSIDNGNFDCAMLGANTITLTGIDNSNNTTTASVNVQVLDTIKPIIVCPSDIEIWTCDEQYNVQSELAEVTEICSYNLINNYNQSANASDSYPLGEHSVLWTVTDAAGNEASCAQQINVYQYPLPTAGFINSTPICEGGAVQLNGLQDLIACTTDCELPNYAASYSNLSHLVYINKVVIDGNEKTSLGTNHSAYTQEPTCTLSADSVVELSISVSNYHSFNYYVSVFIDWNRDGDFDDANEEHALDMQNLVCSQTISIHVPANAVPGKTMLRVVAQMNHQPTASGNYPVGETEDYMLELVQWDNQSIVDYQWEGPNDWSASGIQTSITNLSTVNSGVYKLTVTTFNGCVDTWEKELTVQNPEIAFTADTIVSMCTDTIVLQPGSFDTYMWNNGSQASECQVGDYGTYSVTVSAEGCVAADTVVISECQDILLQSGWNLFSTYINTDDEMSMLLSEIENAISVIKDGDGGIYWPAFNVNSIGNHVKGAGYYGKLSSEVNLRIKGTAVNPLNHVINLVPGYNIVGFLRKYEVPVDVVFENVEPNLLFVKDQTGKIYWPAFNINQVGDLCPGYGYYVLMLNADQLSYPDNASMFNKSMVAVAESQLLKTTLLTNTSMTMAIPLNAWMKQPQLNDEIGVYSAQGNLLGAGVFEGKDMAITIWGADEFDSNSKGSQTGARLIIKLQSAMDHSIHELKVEEWQHGNGTFKNEDYAIVGKIATGASQVESGITAYPNPFVSELRFVYSLQTAGDVVIEVYDLYGKLLLSELKANQQMGSHDYCLNGTSLARGVYQLVLSTKEGSKTVRIEKI